MSAFPEYHHFERQSCEAIRDLEDRSFRTDNDILSYTNTRYEFQRAPRISARPSPASCVTKPPPSDTAYTNGVGYNASREGDFLADPDRDYTFHNYLVREDDRTHCVKNHQYFHNWTKRKTARPAPPTSQARFAPIEPLPTQPLCDVFSVLPTSTPYCRSHTP